MSADHSLWLYLLCGLSFAGKSTLSRQLAGPLGAVVVECDAYIDAVRPNTLSKLAEWRAIQDLARGKVVEHLRAGESVVFDDLMVDPINRVELTQRAADGGARTLTIFVDTPVETIRARQQALAPAPEQQRIWDDHTALLLGQLIPPSPSEAVFVTPGYDLADVLERIARWRAESGSR